MKMATMNELKREWSDLHGVGVPMPPYRWAIDPDGQAHIHAYTGVPRSVGQRHWRSAVVVKDGDVWRVVAWSKKPVEDMQPIRSRVNPAVSVIRSREGVSHLPFAVVEAGFHDASIEGTVR